MLTILALHALLSLGAPPPQADTVVPVAPGARLDLHTGVDGGRVLVRAWDRNEVQVEASQPVRVTAEGGWVRVRRTQAPSASRQVSYDVRVPAWLAVEVNGVQTDVTVEGVGGDVSVTTVRGAVSVQGGQGRVSARSVEGPVSVEGTRGRVEASSVNQLVRVSGVTGVVQAEAVNGSVHLLGVESSDVSASSVNGSVDFEGPILDGGRYRLSSHNGRVSLTVQDNASATITISTFNGEFRTAFPVSITESGPDRRFTFLVGAGSARIEASSFNGDVELRRPGQPPGR